MLLEINQLGEPCLRLQCRDISPSEEDLDHLVANMLETMDAAEGIGLAAPQIGLAYNLVVIDIPSSEEEEEEESALLCEKNGQAVSWAEIMPLVLLNPVIDKLEGKKVAFMEGCLSVCGFRADVHRPEIATVSYLDLEGNKVTLRANGLLARALQHEIDHLNGILFIDRLSAGQKMSLKNKLARVGLPVIPKKPKQDNLN